MQNLTAPGGPGNSNVTCSCNCTASQPQGMEISELEFVQIVIIIVVMTVMVVVIICLLNHYKLSTWSFITRQSQARRHDHALQQDGCLWPSDSGSRQGASEVLYAPQARDRFTAPSFMQRDRFSRFQPTYPYLQHQIDLPPTISLSDGEEPPPYQGPCTLQLRDPEQQMELNRESVRAPPNRTIYDSDLIDMGGGGGLGGVGGGGGGVGGGGPRPPSSNSGISAANSSSHGRMEGPPPAYSEVMGHYPGSAFFLHQHSNNQRVGRPGGPGSRTIQQQSQSESTIVPAKAKDGQPEDLV
uniref:Low density lipoprotein receptor class A domain containing 4 n=1 Tax=Stegastes partitus TaxID=144197 RepID=A0A3B5ADN6_9TELE